MKTDAELRIALANETREFQQYRASIQSHQLIALYDALIDSHFADLVEITPEQLLYKQGAIRQLQALRTVLVTGNPHLSAKA